ncbi:MAG: PAS domain-containing protein [Hyphomonadaceae bacterium]|nr:PAS domain-containing protein [Clostridia bacterium]
MISRFEPNFLTKTDDIEKILENMSEAVLVFDKVGNILNLNKSARAMFLSLFPALTNIREIHTLADFYNAQGSLMKKEEIPCNRVLNGERFTGERVSIKIPSGVMHVEINGSSIHNKKGELIGGIICCYDVTARVACEATQKHNQEQILKVEKEKNEVLEKAITLKDEFLSFISHEFKTPIAIIDSNIQVMEMVCKDELSDKSKMYLKRIRDTLFSQLRLVNNLLDIIKIDSHHIMLKRHNVDVVSMTCLIVESVKEYAHQKNISILYKSTFKRKIIHMDEEKFERILLNLLSNAIKFTPNGKSIVVKVYGKNNFICIDVSDQGIGIAEDQLPCIFKKFGQIECGCTKNTEGTGLGLSLVKLFVEALGGDITVKSQVGLGSTFTVQFPLTKIDKQTCEVTIDDHINKSAYIEFSGSSK